jgi:hypothetical protein
MFLGMECRAAEADGEVWKELMTADDGMLRDASVGDIGDSIALGHKAPTWCPFREFGMELFLPDQKSNTKCERAPA